MNESENLSYYSLCFDTSEKHKIWKKYTQLFYSAYIYGIETCMNDNTNNNNTNIK